MSDKNALHAAKWADLPTKQIRPQPLPADHPDVAPMSAATVDILIGAAEDVEFDVQVRGRLLDGEFGRFDAQGFAQPERLKAIADTIALVADEYEVVDAVISGSVETVKTAIAGITA